MDSSDSDCSGKKRKRKKKEIRNDANNPPELRVFRLDRDFYKSINAPDETMTKRYNDIVQFQDSRKKKLSFVPMFHRSCARYAHLHIICVSSASSRTSETIKSFFKLFFKIDSSSATYKDFIATGTKYNLNQLHQFDCKYYTPKYFNVQLPFESIEDIAAYQSSYHSKKVSPFFDFFRENFLRGPDFQRLRYEEQWCDHEKEKAIKPDLESVDGQDLSFFVRSLPDAPDEIVLKGNIAIYLFLHASTHFYERVYPSVRPLIRDPFLLLSKSGGRQFEITFPTSTGFLF